MDVYISCVLCFQSGGVGRAKGEEEKEGVVEADSQKIHRVGEVEIVSKSFLWEWNNAVTILYFG